VSFRQEKLFQIEQLGPVNNLTNLSDANVTLVCDTEIVDPPGEYRMYLYYNFYRLILFSFIVDTVCVGLLCFVGFVGNALSFIVLWKDKARSTTNFLLRTLAIADTLLLVVCMLHLAIRPIYPYTGYFRDYYEFYPFMVPYLWGTGMTLQTITNWFVVLLTIERYIVVCKPLQASRWCTLHHAKKAIAFASIGAVIYNFPRFFEWQVIVSQDICSNFTVVAAVEGPLRNILGYNIAYRTGAYFLLVAFGPIMILLTMNIRLIQALRRAQRNRLLMTKRSQNQASNTTIIVVVVTVFIICEVPALMHQILLSLSNTIDLSPDGVMLYTIIISNMLVTLNSSANFFIYCLFGRKFRSILKQTLCGNSSVAMLVAYVNKQFTTSQGAPSVLHSAEFSVFTPTMDER
jgi:hypothetical protein